MSALNTAFADLKSTPRMPTLFVGHGNPMNAIEDNAYSRSWKKLGQSLPTPSAILCVSAHWMTRGTTLVNVTAKPETIHDFGGFPPALYDLRYPAPGDALLAREVSALVGGGIDAMRGLDHGAWVPLMLMYPQADVPVVQLSVQSHLGAAHHIALGRKLAKLRADNVLVLGSGGFVHNLRRIAPPGSPEADWSRAFCDWIHERLMAGDEAALADYRAQAPHAAMAQPSEEHFVPLHVAFGAGGEKAARLHSSATFGSLRMDAYSFG